MFYYNYLDFYQKSQDVFLEYSPNLFQLSQSLQWSKLVHIGDMTPFAFYRFSCSTLVSGSYTNKRFSKVTLLTKNELKDILVKEHLLDNK